MKPIEFPEQTTIFAKNQPEYIPLPAHVDKDFIVTSCWQLTWKERFRILFTGKLWISQMTFNQKLQPQKPDVFYPEYLNDHSMLCEDAR